MPSLVKFGQVVFIEKLF